MRTLLLSFAIVGLLCGCSSKSDYGEARGIISVGIPASLGLLITANWEWVFITFHKLVFQNDYWLFDPYTDPVITILPDEFFMHCAALIMLLVLVGSLAFFAAWKKLAKKK